MIRLGQCLAGNLAEAFADRGSIHISGELGAGKTTLCRGLLHAMGHKGAVKSPTFTLVEPYQANGWEVYHFDLYRLGDPAELDYMGVDDYFGPGSLCLIEWPEKAGGCLPAQDLQIGIDVSGKKRNICISANTDQGEKVCEGLKKTCEQVSDST